MNEHTFVIAICILTVAAHYGLLWTRGWVIGQLWKEFEKMRAQWHSFREEQEQWRKEFEKSHKAPWLVNEPKKRTA